ncbi:scyllo-inositol 2-dehydrogenase (NADP(+)) IolU [Paenibacillus solanacearum]|uniref:Scyllo-inositol 2-dehydrogenase (NADP(+)) IolU n=1 Tax=Paenibacillus solanacearum TaxID=2048548 RepID=A0A916K724_9BACL|nr:Gfo/Idh/MocA family oxidoreductase [Paenibacillus solanacearum]CAG7637410.1 scyllo-inositol 2-dehydrogenase (NADP(+)) IolU [Paenibacillus solanacearum]
MIRFGVIGTNWITEKFIEAARKTEGFLLTAVYSRTEAKARAFADAWTIPHCFTDVERMAESPEVDAVYIASPNAFHARQAIACMNRGKHVLCEKPLASNADEVRAMIEAARRNGVVLMEALKSTTVPQFQAVREHLPKIGRVRRYAASYCKYSSRYDAYKQGTVLNAFNPELSNGSLMDLGVYCIYPLAALFGKPEQIMAGGILLDSGVDGQGSLILKYRDMEAVIMHSKISNSDLPAEIQGEDGTMVIDQINDPGHVHIRYRDGSVENIAAPDEISAMTYEVREFIGLLQQNRAESAMNSHAVSLIAMQIMDEARKQMGLRFPADSAMH